MIEVTPNMTTNETFALSGELSVLDRRLGDLGGELKTINDKLDGRPGDTGLKERADNLAIAIQRAQLDYDAKRVEWQDALMSDLDTGRAGGESGFGGRSEPSYRGSGPVEAAKRIIGGLHKSGRLPDHAATKAEGLLQLDSVPDRTLAARWVAATGSDQYARAFAKLLADPHRGHMLWSPPEQAAYAEAKQVQSDLKAMDLTANSELLPLFLDPTVMLTSAGTINPLRRISRVVQTISNTWQGVTSAGVTSEWKTEAAQAADAAPATDPVSIPVFFGDSFVPFSYEVGMDAAGDFTQDLGRLLADGAEVLQAAAYTTGNGTTAPGGLITGATTLVNTVGAFLAPNVFAVQAALPPRFQARAQWCGNIAVVNAIAQFETTAGALKFPEVGDGRLLRRPLNELSDMSADMTTTSSKFLAYGDFQAGFVIADRIGSTVELISNLFGAAGRPTGQRGAMLWFRTGSKVVVPAAFRILNKT